MPKNTNRVSNYLMIDFHIDEIKKYQKEIFKQDIYEDPKTDDYGLQKEPHVTILGDINPKVEWSDFKDFILPLEDFISVIPSISIFKEENYDVLKFDVICENAKIVRDRLIENIKLDTDYPNIDLHMTIAYLKSGKGKKYVKNMLNKIIIKKPYRYHYSIIRNDKEIDEYYTTDDLK
jgi:hypothetical protein